MVLSELGAKLTGALRNFNSSNVVDQRALDLLLKEICNALVQADCDIKLVFALRDSIKKKVSLDTMAAGLNKRKVIQKSVFDELVKLVDPSKAPFKPKRNRTNIIMFVGLQGAGKTTTITKFGYYYRRKGWKVGLVCADTFRAGAFAQLKQNATKAKLAFTGSHTETDPVKAAREGVEQFKAEKYDIILVDTSGRHKQEEALFEEMQQIQEVVQPDDIVFILDASIGQAARSQAEAFRKAVKVGSVVITKMDGHARGGGALSAVAATQSPILFLGTGEHMEDLDMFSPQSFVSRLLGMGDVEGLMETIKDAGNLENQQEMMDRLSSGKKFTLRDLREQFETLLNMGPFSKILEMMPGLGQTLMGKGEDLEQGKKRMQQWIYVMDSMTEKELDNPKLLTTSGDSRIMRVARGSGVHPLEVRELLMQYKNFEKMFSRMGKMNMLNPGKHGAKDPRMMSQNASKMASMLPPQMLAQMGGMQGLQNMMKEMGGMEEMMGAMGRGSLGGGKGGKAKGKKR